jgi:hypothetical protein
VQDLACPCLGLGHLPLLTTLVHLFVKIEDRERRHRKERSEVRQGHKQRGLNTFTPFLLRT